LLQGIIEELAFGEGISSAELVEDINREAKWQSWRRGEKVDPLDIFKEKAFSSVSDSLFEIDDQEFLEGRLRDIKEAIDLLNSPASSPGVFTMSVQLP